MEIKQKLYLHIDAYKNILLDNKKIAVAVSGGMDSLALMFVAKEWCDNNTVELAAITVDHQLREKSRMEAEYVSDLCRKYEIEHHILTWNDEKPDTNVEAAAREARYKLMDAFCRENDIKLLLVAHHLQDQAETFFIRLFRGSGVDGLSAMNDIGNLYSLTILRPFLKAKKEDFKTLLEDMGIKWVEDESNGDEKYLRNKIRNFLNGFDNKNEIIDRINSAIENIKDTKRCIDVLINKIEKNIVSFNSFGCCFVDKNKLLQQDDIIALKILATISMKISGNIYKPRLKKLIKLFENIKNNDDVKYTFYGCVFETYKDNLLVVYREYNSIGEDKNLIFGNEVTWDGRFSIKLKEQVDNIKITHVKKGEFKKILRNVRETNGKKYKEMTNIRNVEKDIFYTLPVVLLNDEYVLDCNFVEIKLL